MKKISTLAEGLPDVLAALGLSPDQVQGERVAFYAGAYLAIILVTKKDADGKTVTDADGHPYLDQAKLVELMAEINAVQAAAA